MRILKLQYTDEESKIIHEVSHSLDIPLELGDLKRYFLEVIEQIFIEEITDRKQIGNLLDGIKEK